MLLIEQLLPGAHPAPDMHGSISLPQEDSTVEFDADVELGGLEEDSARSPHPPTPRSASTSAQRSATPRTAAGDGFRIPTSGKGFALTLGLILHALSNGLALGSSIASDTGSRDLSLVIFAALAIHKGMTGWGVCSVIYFSDLDAIQHQLPSP